MLAISVLSSVLPNNEAEVRVRTRLYPGLYGVEIKRAHRARSSHKTLQAYALYTHEVFHPFYQYILVVHFCMNCLHIHTSRPSSS